MLTRRGDTGSVSRLAMPENTACCEFYLSRQSQCCRQMRAQRFVSKLNQRGWDGMTNRKKLNDMT